MTTTIGEFRSQHRVALAECGRLLVREKECGDVVVLMDAIRRLKRDSMALQWIAEAGYPDHWPIVACAEGTP